jgi:hypothetical protein
MPDTATEPDDGQEFIELADELLVQAAELRRQWSDLAEALGIEAPETAIAAPGAAAEGEADDAATDTVRLVALDMVLAGSSRDEVAEHLRRTFGNQDVDALVDAVFAEYDG